MAKFSFTLLPTSRAGTTHLVAALRFQRLKAPIHKAILNDREDIIKAQSLLAFAGLFRHFLNHEKEPVIGKRMCKHLEKRWSELAQAVFILALVLNPFEKLSRFGSKANIDYLPAMEILNMRWRRRQIGVSRGVKGVSKGGSGGGTGRQRGVTGGITFEGQGAAVQMWGAIIQIHGFGIKYDGKT
ncbi:hypothetical protein B0H14DRAFT_2588615 [Mycena olivaceomarginata]|nr:hypothetical protein B0H14DRAFT_2588615 [Mycena olivaceomarginata]